MNPIIEKASKQFLDGFSLMTAAFHAVLQLTMEKSVHGSVEVSSGAASTPSAPNVDVEKVKVITSNAISTTESEQLVTSFLSWNWYVALVCESCDAHISLDFKYTIVPNHSEQHIHTWKLKNVFIGCYQLIK